MGGLDRQARRGGEGKDGFGSAGVDRSGEDRTGAERLGSERQVWLVKDGHGKGWFHLIRKDRHEQL